MAHAPIQVSEGDEDHDSMDTGVRRPGMNMGDARDSRLHPGEVYNMTHRQRGKFIIINNKTFHPSTGMSARNGTDVDAASLHNLFRRLRFDVQLHKDQTAAQMLQLAIRAAAEDYTDSDCFGMAVLTHGDDGILYGVDAILAVEKLVAPIKDCPTLVGKPKLFFFQACRGTQLDEGVETSDADAVESRDVIQRIPREADFLYCYSTTPGYYSWRNSTRGSWFVQAMTTVLSDESLVSRLDLVRLMTRVNCQVAYQFESNAAQPYMNAKKQVSSIVSMLTKDLYFN